MTTLLYNWRLAETRALLPANTFPLIGLPPIIQYFPKDYAVKSQSAGGRVGRNGFSSYQLLWTRMDDLQKSMLIRIYTSAMNGDGLMRLTGLWHDTSNPVTRWVDLEGYPDLGDLTPNPPAFHYGIQVYSTIQLTLNNITLFNDPAIYS